MWTKTRFFVSEKGKWSVIHSRQRNLATFFEKIVAYVQKSSIIRVDQIVKEVLGKYYV